MLLVIGTVRFAVENLSAARPLMKRMVDASRAEDGCLAYVYAQDMFEEGLIHVTEMWTDRAALEHHLASRHLAEWRAAWPRLGVRDRDLRAYEVADPQDV